MGAEDEKDGCDVVNHHGGEVPAPDFPEDQHADAGDVEAQLRAVVRLYGEAARKQAPQPLQSGDPDANPLTQECYAQNKQARRPSGPGSDLALTPEL